MLDNLLVGQVMGHLRGDDEIETAVGKRQFQCRSGDGFCLVAGSQMDRIGVEIGEAPVLAVVLHPGRQSFPEQAGTHAHIKNLYPIAAFLAKLRRQTAGERMAELEKLVDPVQFAERPCTFSHRKAGCVKIFYLR